MKARNVKSIVLSLSLFTLLGCGGGGSGGEEQSSAASSVSSSQSSSVSSTVSSAATSSAESSSSAGSQSSTSQTAESSSGSSDSVFPPSSAGSSSSSGGGSGGYAFSVPSFFDPEAVHWADGFNPDDVHINDFALIASTNAVTVKSTAPLQNENFNDGMGGSYLEVGESSEEFPVRKRALVSFDKAQIVDALEAKQPGKTLGEISDSITSAWLAVWVERGDLEHLLLYEGAVFGEDTATWNNQPNALRFLSAKTLDGERGWIRLEVPVGLIRQYLTGSASQAAGRTIGGDFQQPDIQIDPDIFKIPLSFILDENESVDLRKELVLSSDETARPPQLVLTYESDTLPDEGVLDALGKEDDAEPARLSVSYSPTDPKIGDTVHVDITATDNKALDYIAVVENGKVVHFKKAPDDHTTRLHLAYDKAVNSSLFFERIYAEDKGGLAGPVDEVINPSVRGNGRAPNLQAQITYQIPEVYPRGYRFIKNDGQQAVLHVHAEDSDGLQSVVVKLGGETYSENPQGAATFDKTYTWVNDASVHTDRFSYAVTVRDREGRESSESSGESLPIRDWDDLPLYANALTFVNTGLGSSIPYTPYMNNIFSYGETHDCIGSHCWRTLKSLAVYDWGVEDVARGGFCWGMSATTVALGRGVLSPSKLQSGAAHGGELDMSAALTKEYVLTMHGSQISDEVFEKTVEYAVHHRHDARWTLWRIIDSLRSAGVNGKYGILAIMDGSMYDTDTAAHAVVPWMVRKISDSEWRVYLYDPNRTKGPRTIQNMHTLPDFDDFEAFPYLVINRDTKRWEYRWSGSERWNGDMYFVPYARVKGDSGQFNKIDEAHHLYVNDHDMPGLDSIWHGTFGYIAIGTSDGDVDLSVETSGGRAVSTKVVPIKLADVDNKTHELYLLKQGTSYDIEIKGLHRGDYNLTIMGLHTTTVIGNKAIEAGKVDTLQLIPDANALDRFKLRLKAGVADTAFDIVKSYRYGVIENGTVAPGERRFDVSSLGVHNGTTLDVVLDKTAESLQVGSVDAQLNFNINIQQLNLSTGTFDTLVAKPVIAPINTPITVPIH